MKFKNLDSIRSLAFLSTFMAHNFVSNNLEVNQSISLQFINYFISIYSFGVPLFFVLSGFLISYLIMDEFEKKKTFNVKNFYIRRILRIWPPYFLVLFIGFVLFPIFRTLILKEPNIENANYLYYISFLSNFDQLNVGKLPIGIGLGVTWSVSVEEQFYLFWPLIFILFNGRKFIYGILFTLVISIVGTLAFNLEPKNTLYCIIYLSTGALFAYLHYYYKDLSKKITDISNLNFILVLIITFSIMKFRDSIPLNNVIIQVLLSFLMSFVILYQIQCNDRMDFKNIFFIEQIGKYTYGLYLYHTICNFLAFSIVRLFGLYDLLGFYFIDVFFRPFFSLFASLVLSYASYHYFEYFFLKLKHKFY